MKRGEAVSRELNKTYGDDKKMSKQEKEERYVMYGKYTHTHLMAFFMVT